jgi:hypothetical protein
MYNNTASEMGHLFYTELGNIGYLDATGAEQTGYGLLKKGPSANLPPGNEWDQSQWGLYWSGTMTGDNSAFGFITTFGQQKIFGEGWLGYAMAVHVGNVGVPEPATMFLLGLVAFRRKLKK